MTVYYQDTTVALHHGHVLDVLPTLPDGSVDCVVTSPPYYSLRDYGVDGQIGAEATPAEYIEAIRSVFAEVRRVIADDATVWINLGDSYATSGPSGQQGKTGQRARRTFTSAGTGGTGDRPPKNLLGLPWRIALALQDDGWILRNDIIWHKVTAMPESVQDRLSNRHEHLFLFSKSRKYFFDLDAIREAHAESTIDAADRARRPYEAPGQTPNVKTRVGNRPQRARAEELAKKHGLTAAHIAAIRSVGVTDTGKATIQTGTGKNRPEIQALADEAKAALGGYYREFLTPAGKNPGDVWSLAAEPFPGAHFATFPSELPRRCIVAGCKPGGTVLDPFHGSGTTGMVATRNGRKYVGIELNKDYLDLSLRTRLADGVLDFGDAS